MVPSHLRVGTTGSLWVDCVDVCFSFSISCLRSLGLPLWGPPVPIFRTTSRRRDDATFPCVLLRCLQPSSTGNSRPRMVGELGRSGALWAQTMDTPRTPADTRWYHDVWSCAPTFSVRTESVNLRCCAFRMVAPTKNLGHV